MITTTATDIQYNEKDIRTERIAEKYENID